MVVFVFSFLAEQLGPSWPGKVSALFASVVLELVPFSACFQLDAKRDPTIPGSRVSEF